MKMPLIGFGCSPFRRDGSRVDLEGAVRVATAAGYKLFDLAELYGNERAVGRALQAVNRRDLFIAGKAWRTSFRPAALRQACTGSLRKLGIDAFDLYLLHAPEAWKYRGPLSDREEIGWEELERRALPRDSQGEVELDPVPLGETWEAMLELVREGLAERIGVSNFGPAEIEALGPDVPAVNQVEHSPSQPNTEVVSWCGQRGIGLMAHSPLSAPGLLAEPLLADLARRDHCSAAQIVLRWNRAKGLVPLPSSIDPSHIAENLRALDGELEPEAMAAIDSLAARTVDSPR
jgi:alcohol dehydrogenase (NADP+)